MTSQTEKIRFASKSRTPKKGSAFNFFGLSKIHNQADFVGNKAQSNDQGTIAYIC